MLTPSNTYSLAGAGDEACARTVLGTMTPITSAAHTNVVQRRACVPDAVMMAPQFLGGSVTRLARSEASERGRYISVPDSYRRGWAWRSRSRHRGTNHVPAIR